MFAGHTNASGGPHEARGPQLETPMLNDTNFKRCNYYYFQSFFKEGLRI